MLIADHLFGSFSTAFKNAVFICCCWWSRDHHFSFHHLLSGPSCSCCFARNSCCLISRSAAAFSRKKSTSGSARLDLRRFGEAVPSSELRFLVSLCAPSLFSWLLRSRCPRIAVSMLIQPWAFSLYGIFSGSQLLNSSTERFFLPQKSHLPSLRPSSFCRTFFGEGSTALVQLFYTSVGILESGFHSDCPLSLPKPVHEQDF